jgi:hypothetical protein
MNYNNEGKRKVNTNLPRRSKQRNPGNHGIAVLERRVNRLKALSRKRCRRSPRWNAEENRIGE